MASPDLDTARRVVQEFEIEGELLALDAHHRGHIHDSFISTWRSDAGELRYLHQRINDRVFTDVPALMHNVERVTRHLERKHENGEAPDGFHVLRLVRTRRGRAYLPSEHGPWRTYDFVERTESFDLCDGPERAYEAARAFGQFQAQLHDLDSEELRETIPRFFSSSHRLQQLDDALEQDAAGRAREAEPEIGFVQARRGMARVIEDRLRAGAFPLRIVHGDTKLNNVLFDRATGRAACVVDLDTCMPGWTLFDFGDLVRFTAATAPEDERDLTKVGTDLALYRALVDGYLSAARDFLTPEEVELMPFAARLVTLTVGMRFLTDHLNGDVYFKVSREGQNLDRARTQLAMVAQMEAMAKEMEVS